MWIWFLGTTWASCSNSPALDVALSDSERAFAELADDIDARRDALHTAIECLDAPIDPARAALTHRTLALFEFLDEDDSATSSSFARYRSLASAPELPSALAPSKHPLRKLYDSAKPADTTRDLPKPKRGSLYVDGREVDAPAAEPFLLQHIHKDDVLLTALVGPGAPLPVLDGSKNEDRAPKTPRTPKSQRGVKAPFLVAGGAALVAGGALYAGGFASRASYDKAIAARDREQARSTHTVTNALTATGIGLMGAGIGLGVVGVL